jgi:hypothetical protein
MASDTAPLTADDRALLDRVARRVVELRLEVPALLALESCRPLSLLASQSMLFFEPLVQALLRMGQYRRFALLTERRAPRAARAALRADRAGARPARARRAGAEASPPGDAGASRVDPGH